MKRLTSYKTCERYDPLNACSRTEDLLELFKSDCWTLYRHYNTDNWYNVKETVGNTDRMYWLFNSSIRLRLTLASALALDITSMAAIVVLANPSIAATLIIFVETITFLLTYIGKPLAPTNRTEPEPHVYFDERSSRRSLRILKDSYLHSDFQWTHRYRSSICHRWFTGKIGECAVF